MQAEASALKRLVSWFREAALPLWAARGYDKEGGGFFEALDFDGAPVSDAPRRVRVQARQVYVFSNAARLGWHRAADEIARAGFDDFLAQACPDEGARGCIHKLAPDGAPLDDRRDLYDQAFLLLACASFWEAFGDRRALDLAARAAAFLDDELAAPGGGYREDDRNGLPRRQNPHMHLLEAFLALGRATGDPVWARRADRIVALCEARFFDCAHGVLREFFSEDLSAPDAAKGNVIEPGHMAEWVWLLDQYGKAGGKPDPAISSTLFENAFRIGRDPESGFLVDRLELGEPPTGKTRRLWPQTEYIKACLARAACGDSEAAENAEDMAQALLSSYLDQKVAGLWCDQYDGDGAPIAKETPASILYHLFDAVRETEIYLGGKDE